MARRPRMIISATRWMSRTRVALPRGSRRRGSSCSGGRRRGWGRRRPRAGDLAGLELSRSRSERTVEVVILARGPPRPPTPIELGEYDRIGDLPRVTRASPPPRPPARAADHVDDQAGDIVLRIVGNGARSVRTLAVRCGSSQVWRTPLQLVVGDDARQPVGGQQEPVAWRDVEHPDVPRGLQRWTQPSWNLRDEEGRPRP